MSEVRAIGPELVPLQDVLTAQIDARRALEGGELDICEALIAAVTRLRDLGLVMPAEADLAAAIKAAGCLARPDGRVTSRAVACSLLGALAGQGEALRAAAQRVRAEL